jgi:DNA-directed RNA polymerase subunit N (RpoN/RPB10)
MIYSSCPTCGYCIGTKVVEFEKKKEEICNNPNLNEKQREEEISKAIKSAKLRRYCCSMRLMASKDLVKDILPINDD